MAVDSGEPALSATATLRLIVEDRNDEKPRFERSVTTPQRLSRPTFYRAMLCIRGTSHGTVSVRLSNVHPSVCPSVLGSHNNTTRYPRDSCFLKSKISAKFDRGHPLRVRQMQVGWVKIGNFRQIIGYISKTVNDRHIVSIKVELRLVTDTDTGPCLVPRMHSIVR